MCCDACDYSWWQLAEGFLLWNVVSVWLPAAVGLYHVTVRYNIRCPVCALAVC